MRHRLFTLLVLLGVLGVWSRFVLPDTARAMSTIIVDSEDDDVIPVTDGFCTLREAIVNANDNTATFADCAAGSGADTIILNDPFGEILLNADLPTITDDLAIEAGTPFYHEIDGDNLYRPFTITAGVTVSISQIIVNYGYGDFGGAVNNAGDLTLTSVIFEYNEADYGAAVYNSGTLTITDSEFYGHSVGADGGAIYNNGGFVSITDSDFTLSEAENGGAIYNLSGTVNLANVTFEAMGASVRGGAIFNEGTLNVYESLFQFNDFGLTPDDGGAIYNEVGASLRVIDSIFRGLEADDRGGAIFLDEAGAAGTAVITGSLFESISVSDSAGGAIYSLHAGLVIANSLLATYYSDQIAIVIEESDATIYNTTIAYGGVGIRAIDSTVTLNHNTIIDQESHGLVLNNDSTADVANTIFENAFATADCDLPSGAELNDLGGNLASDASCALTNGGSTAAGMLFIAPNGGWMLSSALPVGSPAIANATGPAPLDLADANNNGNTIELAPFDGRGDGFVRTVGGSRDSGAFQTNTGFIDLIVDRLDDTPAGACTPAPNDCTLRGAVDLANRIGGGVEITFGVTGVIEIDQRSAFFINRGYSSIVINESMDIVGPGAGLLTVRESAIDLTRVLGAGLAEENSIFLVASGFCICGLTEPRASKVAAGFEPVDPIEVNISGLTIQGGSDFTGGALDIRGTTGGIIPVGGPPAESQIDLQLQDMNFIDNQGVLGGAIFSVFDGTLLIRGSVFERNSALRLDDCGCEFISESTRAQFSAPKERAFKPAAGFGFFFDGFGGAIASLGRRVVIFDSLFAYNNTGQNGGGGAIGFLDVFGEVFGPSAERFPDDIPFSLFAPLTVVNTTFYGNDSFTGGTAPGLIFYLRDPVTPSGVGGAVLTSTFSVFANVTFAANQSGEGSSIYFDEFIGFGEVYLLNTLLQDGSVDNDNCGTDPSYFVSETSVSDDDSCNSSLGGADPILDPLGLQDNGGRSRTVAILPDSEAVNQGTTSLAATDLFDLDNDDDTDEFYPYDQRGAPFARISGGRIDIGAYELQGETPELTAILTPDPVDVTEGATIGDFICVTLDPAPTSDVTVRVQVAASATSRLTLVDPSNPAVAASFFDIFFNVGAVDPTVCNPGQQLGVRAIFGTSDPEGVESLAGAIEAMFDSDVLTTADVNVYDPGVALTAFVPNPAQEGGSATYSIALSGPPGIRNAAGEYETVTVNLRTYNVRFITPAPTSLTFTRANWNTPQTVNIAVIEDSVDRGNLYNTSITHPTASNVLTPYDSRYGGPTPNIAARSARITMADNDLREGEPLSDAHYDALNLAAWLDLQTSGAIALEGGSAYVLNVRLNGQPIEGEHVVIDLSSIEGVLAMPAQIIFTAHNWDIYQPVQIAVVPDGETQGLRAVPLQVFITPDSTAQDFIGAADVVLVSITDDPNGVPIVPALPEMMPLPLAPESEPDTSAEGSVTE
jgi:CSLREA domain-containing protein